VALEFPPQFQERLARGESTSVQMQVDATNSVLGFFAYSYASEIVARFGLEAGLARQGLTEQDLNTLPVIENEERIWFNPNQNETWFMSITELLNIITLFAILLPAAAMVREKERGTVEQLLVSPLSPFQIMFPKVISMTLVILGGTALSLFAVLQPAFGVPVKGSLALFFGVTVLYTFSTTGVGLLIATVSRNLGQAGMLALVIFAPMVFLSGAWTPPEAMPWLMRGFMYISPLHYYLDASLALLLKGGGISLIWEDVAGIALLGGSIFVVSLGRFRQQFR
jgi:ABC-2 type transport system permease protein